MRTCFPITYDKFIVIILFVAGLLVSGCGYSTTSVKAVVMSPTVGQTHNFKPVGNMMCPLYDEGDYPADGHLVDCTTSPGSNIFHVFNQVNGDQRQGNVYKTARLKGAGISFYLFDDLTQYRASGLDGSSDVSLANTDGAETVAGKYSAIFTRFQSPFIKPGHLVLGSTLEAITRHEIGHHLVKLLDSANAFKPLIDQDLNDLNQLSNDATINLFNGQRADDVVTIIYSTDAGGWAPGYSGLTNSLRMRKAYPNFFCAAKVDGCDDQHMRFQLYNELEAEAFAIAQVGTSESGITFVDVYVVPHFKRGFDLVSQLFNTAP